MSDRINIYIKDLNEELDKLYAELEELDFEFSEYNKKNSRKAILSKIERLENAIDSAINYNGYINSKCSKDYSDDDDV